MELVKKDQKTILTETINILSQYIKLKEIIGIYLVGSYARGEETKDSDIDILAITDDIDKEMISHGIYNILIVSSKLLNQKLNEDLLPIGPMIKEAKPLINEDYIKSIEVNVTDRNVRWYLDTTRDKINLIKKSIEKSKNKKYIEGIVAYTLVLRIRTLYIIEKLIKNKNYSKKDFTELINKISGGENAYKAYLDVKKNSESSMRISLDEAEKLCSYLQKQLSDIKI